MTEILMEAEEQLSGVHEGEEWSLITWKLRKDWLESLNNLQHDICKFLTSKPFLGTNKFGKAFANRDVAFFSDVVPGYKLSKIRDGGLLKSTKMDKFPILQLLLERVNLQLKEKYNGIIVNYYKTGHQRISPHFDNPAANGNHGVVTISLGATRDYCLREISNPEKIVFRLKMLNGYVVGMMGALQKKFTHEVPEDLSVTTARMSLTFRAVPLQEENEFADTLLVYKKRKTQEEKTQEKTTQEKPKKEKLTQERETQERETQERETQERETQERETQEEIKKSEEEQQQKKTKTEN